jgi:hypothetical protein
MVQLTQQKIYLDNMNRILKRPMFRIGGSAGTGITSGLDKPRTNYQFGGGADARRFIQRPMTNTTPLNTTPTPTLSRREQLLKALGTQPNNRNLSQFLTTFGLNLLSASPQGNIFQTAATAAKEPTEQLFAGMDAERNLQRQVSLAAAEADLAQKDAIALQLLKNDEVSALPYQRKIQYLMEKLQIPEADAIRFVETSKTDYTKLTDEAKIQKELDKMNVEDITFAEFKALVLPKLQPNQRPRSSEKIRSRGEEGKLGKFPRNPAVGVIYPDTDTGKLYEYNGGEPNDINSYTDVTEQYR